MVAVVGTGFASLPFFFLFCLAWGFFFFGRREPHGKEWRCNRADNPFTHLVRYILIDCKSESTAGSAFQLLRSRAAKGGVGRASWFQLVTTARSSLPVRSPFHDHLTRFASFRPARPWPIVMTTARRDGDSGAIWDEDSESDAWAIAPTGRAQAARLIDGAMDGWMDRS